MQSNLSSLLTNLTNKDSWDTMPEAKCIQGQPGLYFFKPSLTVQKVDTISENDLFVAMLERFKNQLKENSNLKSLGVKYQKDVGFSDTSRASYTYLPEAKDYSKEPHCVIKKNRVDDINIKSA